MTKEQIEALISNLKIKPLYDYKFYLKPIKVTTYTDWVGSDGLTHYRMFFDSGLFLETWEGDELTEQFMKDNCLMFEKDVPKVIRELFYGQ